MGTLAALLVVLSSVATDPALPARLPEVSAGPAPVVRGALAGDWAYTYGLAEWDPAAARPARVSALVGARVLLRCPVRGGDRELYDLQRGWQERQWPSRGTAAPVRWQVAAGALLCAGYSLPGLFASERVEGTAFDRPPPKDPLVSISRLPLTADALAACRVESTRRTRQAVGRQAVAARRFWQPSVYSPEPFNDLFPSNRLRSVPPLPPADRLFAHYDFLPGPYRELELFVGTPGRLVRYELDERRDGQIQSRTHREIGSYHPRWVGPFYVCADGADRHFVTAGGRVFTLPAGSDLALTRQGDPVLALIHDTDAGKSYAFTKSHYFHVTAKPAPKPQGLTAFPGATAEEALATVAKCGRVIRGLAP